MQQVQEAKSPPHIPVYIANPAPQTGLDWQEPPAPLQDPLSWQVIVWQQPHPDSAPQSVVLKNSLLVQLVSQRP